MSDNEKNTPIRKRKKYFLYRIEKADRVKENEKITD